MSKKLIFLLFPAILFAQNLNLRLTTTAYMWQRQETPEISTNHLRAYQLALNFNLSIKLTPAENSNLENLTLFIS
ncbi:hypothetical protein JGI17_11902 [Candidatus Kryptonium thompsonii]|nr:hypothetical protein JGI17_11902 [Candidatus Kryptonium thompsoni]